MFSSCTGMHTQRNTQWGWNHHYHILQQTVNVFICIQMTVRFVTIFCSIFKIYINAFFRFSLFLSLPQSQFLNIYIWFFIKLKWKLSVYKTTNQDKCKCNSQKSKYESSWPHKSFKQMDLTCFQTSKYWKVK